MINPFASPSWMRVAQMGHNETYGLGVEVDVLGTKFLHLITPPIDSPRRCINCN